MLVTYSVEYPIAPFEYQTDNQSPYDTYNSVDSLDNVDQCLSVADFESLIGYRADDENESIESNSTPPSASTNEYLDSNQASKTGMLDLVDGQLDTAIEDFQRYNIDCFLLIFVLCEFQLGLSFIHIYIYVFSKYENSMVILV
jgi:hypothetical protein